MADVITTDLFKFIAIRPAQLVTEKETRRTIIRDVRAQSTDGIQTLTLLARDLASSGAAITRWRELDLSALAPLFDGYRVLLRQYEQLDTSENPPDGRDFLKKAGIPRTRNEDDVQLAALAWNALYIANCTGPDAGPLLETPLAALRVLHFAQLLGENAHLIRTDALEILRATPAIPTQFYEALTTPAISSPAEENNTDTIVTRTRTSAHSARLRNFAQELDATNRLSSPLDKHPLSRRLLYRLA